MIKWKLGAWSFPGFHVCIFYDTFSVDWVKWWFSFIAKGGQSMNYDAQWIVSVGQEFSKQRSLRNNLFLMTNPQAAVHGFTSVGGKQQWLGSPEELEGKVGGVCFHHRASLATYTRVEVATHLRQLSTSGLSSSGPDQTAWPPFLTPSYLKALSFLFSPFQGPLFPLSPFPRPLSPSFLCLFGVP